MKNKRKIICWAVLGALLLCAAVVLALTRGRDPEPAISPNAPTGAPTEPADPTALPVETSRPPESTAPTEMPSTGRPAASTDPEPSGETTIAPEKTEPPQATTAPTSPIEAPPETEPTGGASSISLPYEIPDTGLVVAKVAAYDGIFLEDGSNEEITGVAAMVLTNTADTAVEFAGITLTAGTETWEFRASAIPAGATVVVQEANRTHFRETAYGDCKADVATLPELEMSSDQVEVTEHGGNSLTVTNLTGASIPVVRVFYKYYLEDMDAYVGGIAYTAKVENLEAGASVQITPTPLCFRLQPGGDGADLRWTIGGWSMKIKGEFIMRELVGEILLVPVGQTACSLTV